MQMKKVRLLVLTLALVLVMVPFAKAGPARLIRIIPAGGVETGEPIVTGPPFPAELVIFAEGQVPVENIWLIIVLNDDTYQHLIEIEVNGVTFVDGDFVEILGTESAAFTIPPDTPPIDGVGILEGDKYNAGSLRDKLGATGESIWYAYKDSEIDEIWGTPMPLSVTVDSPGCDDLKALILAVGQYYPDGDLGPFNRSTPYSGSTLVVPEIGTLLLAAASFSAFALYALKRRK